MARIRREEGLKVSKRQRRMRRLGISTAERQRAERPGQVWSWDFVADQTENGSSFRILTLLDEHTRQCLAMHPAWSIRALDVITVVEAAIARWSARAPSAAANGPRVCLMHAGLAESPGDQDALHQARKPLGERTH